MKEYDFEKKNLYNGALHHAGMRVVPFVIENQKVGIELGVKPEFMETFHLPNGKKYAVAFTEVPEEDFEKYMTVTYVGEIRAFFDNYGEVSYKEKFSRCTINGEVCPLYKHCSKCTEKDSSGRPRRESKRGMMSLDKVTEDGHDPTGGGIETEESLLSDILESAARIKKNYSTIIKRTHDGYKPHEFLDELSVKKTQAYQDVKDALEYVRDYIKE